MGSEGEVRAAHAALDARAAYVRRRLRWGWFVLGVLGVGMGAGVANLLWGPWWWAPWVLTVWAVWGVVVVWRMVRLERRYRRLMGDL